MFEIDWFESHLAWENLIFWFVGFFCATEEIEKRKVVVISFTNYLKFWN